MSSNSGAIALKEYQAKVASGEVERVKGGKVSLELFLKMLEVMRPKVKYVSGFESYSSGKAKFTCSDHGDFFSVPRLLTRSNNGGGCVGCAKVGKVKPILGGFGLNDVLCEGRHPLYLTWYNLLRRCYHSKEGDKYDSNLHLYENVTCDESWSLFSKFLCDFENIENSKNYKHGWVIDKDLFSDGEVRYSVETCCIIPREINLYIANRSQVNFEVGVCYDYEINKYFSYIVIDGKRRRCGSFEKECDAKANYNRLKKIELLKLVDKYRDVLSDAIINRLNEWEY